MSAVLGLSASENHLHFPVHLRKITSPIIAVLSATYSPCPVARFVEKSAGSGDGICNRTNDVEGAGGDDPLRECVVCAKSEECTECLGFESLTMKSPGSESTVEDVTTAAPAEVTEEEEERGESDESSMMRRRRGGLVIDRRSETKREKGNIFPPLLTTLNENGRPLFDLEKVRRDGRLVIYMLKNARREIVRFVESDGRVTMQLLEDDSGDESGENDDVDDATDTESGVDDGVGSCPGGDDDG